MNRAAYRKIAKANRVSVAEVKREMVFAIDAAYQNPTQEALRIPRSPANNVKSFSRKSLLKRFS